MTAHPFFTASPERPLIIAHRGARAHAPENTLSAGRLAHAYGADLWELDVARTRDGVLVVIHDDTCARTTDATARPTLAGRAPWRVADMTLAEMRELDAGSWFVETDPFGRIALGDVGPLQCATYRGEHVPTLAEALELTRTLRWRVNIEIKDHAGTAGDATVVDDVVRLVCAHGMHHAVLLSSFRHDYMREAHRIHRGIATALLFETAMGDDPAALCRDAGAVALHPRRDLLAPCALDDLSTAGVCVNTWTVNDIPEVLQLARDGVDGIITDVPAACLAALRMMGLRAS